MFLLVGLAIPPAQLLDALGPIAWGIVAILVGRALVVYVILGGSSRLAVRPGLAERIPVPWLHVLFWAGLRGAVALAMALSLPADIPQRALLQEVTFGIILFTLLIQGTTIGWVVDSHGAARRRDWRGRLDLASSVEPATVGIVAFGRSASTGRAQDPVQLGPVVPADRRPVEPLDVLDVVAGDLAQRPAGIAAEVEDRPRRATGRRASGAVPFGRAHRFVVGAALGRTAGRPVARHHLRRRRRWRGRSAAAVNPSSHRQWLARVGPTQRALPAAFARS